jgi:hypothetical protein
LSLYSKATGDFLTKLYAKTLARRLKCTGLRFYFVSRQAGVEDFIRVIKIFAERFVFRIEPGVRACFYSVEVRVSGLEKIASFKV